MTDLAIRAVMTADGSGLVTGAKQAQTALDGLRGSHDTLSVASKNLTTASRELRAANDETGLSTYRLTRAMSELGGPMGARVLGMRELLRGSHELIEGLGLLNTGAIALGIGFLAAVGHTTVFRNALHDVEEIVGSAWDGFDRIVSGTQAVARAQAEGVVTANDWLNKFKEIDDAQDKLTAAGKTPPPVPLQQTYVVGPDGSVVFAGMPERGPTPEEASALKRSSDALSQQKTKEFNDRFGIVNAQTSQQFGVSSDQLKIAREISETYTRFSVEQHRKEDEVNRQAEAAAKQWQATLNESNNRFIHDFKPQGIAGFDSLNVAQGLTGNPLGIQTNGKDQASQRINDAREMREEISKIERDADESDADALQKSLDEMHAAYVKQVDEVRSTFDDFGTSAITNFRNAAQAADQFLTKLEQMAVEMYIMRPLSESLFGVQGQNGSGLLGGALQSILPIPNIAPGIPESVAISGNQLTAGSGFLSSAGNFIAGLFHTGGIIGSEGSRRYVHPAYFDNARRMHGGGIASDEVPIIARKGEGVFTQEQMKAMGGGNAPNVTVNVHNNSGGQARVQQSQDANGNLNLDIIVDQVQTKIADTMQRGSSPVSSAIENIYGVRRSPR